MYYLRSDIDLLC